jgi:hypothetical protein
MVKAKRRCEFQGGTGLEEKYRPKSPCLGEFEPNSPNQKNCAVCRPSARRMHNAREASKKYRAAPKKYAKRSRENRWKQRKADGRPCPRLGVSVACKYRDKRGKRGAGCLTRFERRSSFQRFCPVCRTHAEADRAREYREAHPEKEKARGVARWKTVREQLRKIKAGEFIPARPIEQGTKVNIQLAARLLREGLKPYQMTDRLYPPGPDFSALPKREQAADRAKRFDRTKKFLRYHKHRIELEQKGSSPSSDLSTEIHSLP